MIVFAAIAAYILIGFIVGYFVARDTYRNGVESGNIRPRVEHVHDTSFALGWWVLTIIAWGFLAITAAIVGVCIGAKKAGTWVFSGRFGDRVFGR